MAQRYQSVTSDQIITALMADHRYPGWRHLTAITQQVACLPIIFGHARLAETVTFKKIMLLSADMLDDLLRHPISPYPGRYVLRQLEGIRAGWRHAVEMHGSKYDKYEPITEPDSFRFLPAVRSLYLSGKLTFADLLRLQPGVFVPAIPDLQFDPDIDDYQEIRLIMLSQSTVFARTILGQQNPATGFRTTEAPRKVMLSAKFLARGLGGVIALSPVERSWGRIAVWQRLEIISCFDQLLSVSHHLYGVTGIRGLDYRAVHHAGIKKQLVSICAVVNEIAARLGQSANPSVSAEDSALLCSWLLSALAVLEPVFEQTEDVEIPGEVTVDLDNGLSDIARYFG